MARNLGRDTEGPLPRKEPKAPTSIGGPIGERWRALGGMAWGQPAENPMRTSDGRGLWVQFIGRDGTMRSIIWTAQTGARVIFGEMNKAWRRLNGERGLLGYPTSDEMRTHDGVGRWQTFERGMIVWHPETGAHEVHGDILARYTQLGGSAYGYPTTDETATPDGRGRFNHFREMPGRADKSIYWTPQTGAHEVFGLIRARWAELGWERSHLGYPTTGELPWSGARGGRMQSFTGGRIFYTPRDGAYADPMQWLHLIREGGFKGQVEVTAHSDGKVQLRGYVRSSAAVGYEYLVQSMLRADNDMAVAFTHQGKVTSTHGSDEKDALFGEVDSPVVRAQFPAFQRGSLVVRQNHRNRFTSALGGLLEALVKFTVGEIVITPAVGLILVAGTEVGSLISSGSLVPGARIIDGTLWLAGTSGTLFALAADGLARLATKEVTLSQADYDFANQVFRGSLPPREKIVLTNSLGGGGRPFTYPRFDGKIVLNLGDHYTNPRGYITDKRPKPGQLLIHELVHAWQYHNNAAAISYVGDALWARLSEDYNPGRVLSEPWDSFGLEEQATIVDRWFAAYHQNLDAPDALRDQAFRFIRDNIRTGRN